MLSQTYIRPHAKGHRAFMDPVPACFRRPSIKAASDASASAQQSTAVEAGVGKEVAK